MSPTQGQQAPDFSLPDQNGKQHKLSDYAGRWIVLYFYPKDDTPGCTVEACSFRDNLPHFKDIHAEVLGVSVDSVDSHKKFEEKHGLPFTILADESKQVVELYGVWREKEMAGNKFMGTVRTSFLINPEGIVAKVYEQVKPEDHIAQVLEDLKAMQ